MKNQKTANVYRITNKINGFVYIGQTTKTLDERLNRHFYNAKYGANSNPVYNDIRKFGPDAFRIELLEIVPFEDRLKIEAQYTVLAKKKGSCYNIHEGNGIKGEQSSFYGKSHTEETKAKISAAQKGEKHHLYGKSHTEETKAKISVSTKGKNNPMYGRTGAKHPSVVSVLDTYTGITYSTRNAAAVAIGKSTTYIRYHTERFKYNRTKRKNKE